MNDLENLAARLGIAAGYHDVFGNWHAAGQGTIERLVQAISPTWDGAQVATSGEAIRGFQGDGRKLWTLTVQLYGLRSKRNWGHGDFGDLKRLIEVAAAQGVGAIGLNPLHALFPDRPAQASPYAPNSRLFLNVFYIDIDALPEFPGLKAAGLDEAVTVLRATELIDYADAGAAKLKGLRLAYEHFAEKGDAVRRADFEAYRAEQGEALLRFACFETLRALHEGTLWPHWPAPWASPSRADLEGFRREHRESVEFHEYCQWIADRQLWACQEAAIKGGMPIGLYIDLAVGIDPMGADAWAQQGAILRGISVGAPPDEFNTAGQDWGLAPFNPLTVASGDYAPMRALMRAAMRHAGAIRLDHVLGLKRIFMIPHGLGARGGAYVAYPFEGLLRVVAEESNAQRCIVIGEDLGTVPEGFRETCARYGLWTYRVILFERDHEGRFLPPEHYPEEALAGFNTHDLPTFAGWLEMHDLAVKQAIGVDPGESEGARRWAQEKLREVLAWRAPGQPPDQISTVATFLAQTPCRLVAVSLEDALGELEQVNVPGTIGQHPNWRRKAAATVEELRDHPGFQRLADAFRNGGRTAR